MRRLIMALLVAGLSTGAHAADPAEIREHYLDMRIYGQDGLYDYFTQSCLTAAPARAAEMQPALAAWRTEYGAVIERGRVAAARLYPDWGSTEEARRETLRKRHAETFDAEIAANPDRTCWRGLQSIRFGVPMVMTGTTLTDRNLRHDVFKQAFVGAAALGKCRDFDALDTHVASDTGTGAERRVEETWTFKGCGAQTVATVRHGPAPGGGSNFVVSFANPEAKKQ